MSATICVTVGTDLWPLSGPFKNLKNPKFYWFSLNKKAVHFVAVQPQQDQVHDQDLQLYIWVNKAKWEYHLRIIHCRIILMLCQSHHCFYCYGKTGLWVNWYSGFWRCFGFLTSSISFLSTVSENLLQLTGREIVFFDELPFISDP